jgi:hypothetical protein
MLGFILSKMQMLLFATAMFVLVLVLLNFISGFQVNSIVSSNLELYSTTISSQLTNDSLCSFETVSLPDFFAFGVNNSSRLYYDLSFSKIDFGNDIEKLVVSVKEHNKDIVVAATSINVFGEVVLLDPGFIAADDPITDEYYLDDEPMLLYPRESSAENYSPPNAFVALKQINKGDLKLFIIPCTTYGKTFSSASSYTPLTNCEKNILKVGCAELKKTYPIDDDRIHQCFEVERQVTTGGDNSSSKRKLTWSDCLEYDFVS